jgi:hypothetical protein
MRRPVALLLAALLTAAGCRSNPRRDLLEAELRSKDTDMRQLKGELERTEAYNQYLQRELRNVQQATPGIPVTEGVSASRVNSLLLGRQTGGVDDDNLPGDEALQVVLEPRDGDNHTLKVNGVAQIQALEILPEGLKRPLCAWHVDQEQLRKSWRSGLLTTGYFLTLPWKNWPSQTKIRVVAQFVGEDGRLFEAERDVTVRLAPEAMRRPPTPTPEPPLPLPLPPPRELDAPPPPRKIDEEKKPLPAPREEKPGPAEVKPPEIPIPSTLPPAESDDPMRPLKGAVLLLKPSVKAD